MTTTKTKKRPKTGGRQKGSQNKVTIEFKQALNNLMDMATPKMVEWLTKVADDDPDKALRHVYNFAQFSHPLLAKQDINQRYVDKKGEDLTEKDLQILKQYEQKILNKRGDNDRVKT